MNGLHTLKGESVLGDDLYMEYHVDNTAARELIGELFYEPYVPESE